MKTKLNLKMAMDRHTQDKKRAHSNTVNGMDSTQKAKMFKSLISSQEFLVPDE